MRAVLGIDAAWTNTQPSGVAVVVDEAHGWRLAAVASSYQHFLAPPDGPIAASRPQGSVPDVPALLLSAVGHVGHAIDLIAVDMPLARFSIVGRRASDDAVSRAYGIRKCGTHTPDATRPGRISDDLRESFERAGYRLCTSAIVTPGLIEVYPHPALVELVRARERLPYKASKVRGYWPSLSPQERRTRLLAQWAEIVRVLDAQISRVVALMPKVSGDASGWQMKAYEDVLDAIVCAWVGVCVLDGRAKPLGDEGSAIWVPTIAVPSEERSDGPVVERA